MKILPVPVAVACAVRLFLGSVVAAPSDSPAAPSARPPLTFLAYDGDFEKLKPADMTFQVQFGSDRRLPSEFVSMGSTVPGTHLKIVRFEHKTRAGSIDGEEDISELTLKDTVSGETSVLVIRGRK